MQGVSAISGLLKRQPAASFGSEDAVERRAAWDQRTSMPTIVVRSCGPASRPSETDLLRFDVLQHVAELLDNERLASRNEVVEAL
jgi:hypothetical protein